MCELERVYVCVRERVTKRECVRETLGVSVERDRGCE